MKRSLRAPLAPSLSSLLSALPSELSDSESDSGADAVSAHGRFGAEEDDDEAGEGALRLVLLVGLG